MPAREPTELHQLFAEAVNRGDPDGVVALYEPLGVSVPEPERPVAGTHEIRRAVVEFLGLQPAIEVTTTATLSAGDVALLRSTWRMRGADAAGCRIELAGRSIEVARKQPDGTWLYVIDDPWGGGAP